MRSYTVLELAIFARGNLKKDAPIIIQTVQGLESAVLNVFEIGADEYARPFDPTELISKIKRF